MNTFARVPDAPAVPRPRLLLVGSDEPALRAMGDWLHREGYQVDIFSEVGPARRQIGKILYDLALVDAELSEHLGVRTAFQEAYPKSPILWLAALPPEAAERLGVDIGFVLTKPVRNQSLLQAIDLALKNARLAQSLDRDLAGSSPFQQLIGTSPAWQAVVADAELLAAGELTVVMQGDTGVGKSDLAEAIHRASMRREYPLITVDLTGTPEPLQMDTLFGHVKGGFTGADKDRIGKVVQAHHSSLFLDEIGDLKPDAQAALLRVLQKRVVTPVGSND
jgi:DNA-binding NtrC family response regulator